MAHFRNIPISLDSQKVWENSEKWPKVASGGDFCAKTARNCTKLHGTGFALHALTRLNGKVKYDILDTWESHLNA